MSEPTHQDVENARHRQAIAEHFRRQYEEALALAESVFGPGWEPTGRHDLIPYGEADRCRMTGERPSPAASVYTAQKDGQKRHFTVTDGQAREVSGYEEGFGPMLTEPDPERTIEVKGATVRPHRYGLFWSGYEPDYRPQSAEALAAARERREEKKDAKERDEIEKLAAGSLFPEWILEQAEEQKKGRKR